MKYFCILCGNRLNPKIHHKPDELGHTSKEVAEYQKKLLSLLLKSMYIENKLSGKKVYFKSIIESLERG